jgi:hypothetical protein
VQASGHPIQHRLRDVAGNSNIGRRAYDWQFTIGPVHPWCYCVLYRATIEQPTEATIKTLAQARETTLRKAIQHERHPGKDHRTNPDHRFEDVTDEQLEQRPPQQAFLIKAIRQAFSEDHRP